MSQFCTYFC